jgi:hypothetical protein
MAEGREQSSHPPRAEFSWMEAVEEVLDAQMEDPEDLEAAFDDLEVDVPIRFGEEAPYGRWGLDGTVRISVDGMRGGLAEWLQYWSERRER